MLKYLRIAVTALSLTACVLLVALWVRSFYRLDTVAAWPGHTLSSLRGRLFIDGRFIEDETSEGYSVVRFLAGTSIPIDSGAADLKAQATGMPIWFLTLCATCLAALPSLRWTKRFSLRTLLIATTLVAAVLGIVVAVS